MSFQLFDLLSTDEYEALKADIQRRGVLVPVEYDEHGNLLDGHHRVRACDELGVVEYPRVTRVGLTDEEKEEHVVTLNLRRRHLNQEQKRRWVAWFLNRHSEWSDRKIATEVGVHNETVGAVRSELTESVSSPPRTVGKDGKSRPARRTSAIVSNSPKEHAKAQKTAKQALDKGKDLPAGHLPLKDAAKAVTGAHVGHNSGENEWYTPSGIIEAARQVLGEIELDPASSVQANKVVGAATFYSIEDDGLAKEWSGRVWMNPPYSSDLIGRFTQKLGDHFVAGDVPAAIVLVNNATETQWFQSLAKQAAAICFPERRVRFWGPSGEPGAPLQGQAFLYLGDDIDQFSSVFGEFGLIVQVRR